MSTFKQLLDELSRQAEEITIPNSFYFTRALISANILPKDYRTWNDVVNTLVEKKQPEKLSFNEEVTIHDLKERFPEYSYELTQVTYNFPEVFDQDDKFKRIILIISFCYKIYILDLQEYRKEYKIEHETQQTPTVYDESSKEEQDIPEIGQNIHFLEKFDTRILSSLIVYLLTLKITDTFSMSEKIDLQIYEQFEKTDFFAKTDAILLHELFIDSIPDRFLVELFPLCIQYSLFGSLLTASLKCLLKDSFIKFSSIELENQIINEVLVESLRTISEFDFEDILEITIFSNNLKIKRKEVEKITFTDESEIVVNSLKPYEVQSQLEQMRLFEHLMAKQMENAADMVKTGFIDPIKQNEPVNEEKKEYLLRDLKRLRAIISNILPCNAELLRQQYQISGEDGYFVACETAVEIFQEICEKNEFLNELRK